ncbi:11069_t:CDS:2, partial [Diversispora eburnea]
DDDVKKDFCANIRAYNSIFVFISMDIRLDENLTNKLCLSIRADHDLDQHVYNIPTISQVATVLIEGNEPTEYTEHDIIMQLRSQELQWVSELNGYYDPIQYPLLFFQEDYSWYLEILQNMS